MLPDHSHNTFKGNKVKAIPNFQNEPKGFSDFHFNSQSSTSQI